MSFGERMQEALRVRGMSQADLCRKTGLKSGHITPYITNPDRDPRLSTAVKIADALNVSLDYLAGRSEQKAIRYADAEVSSAAARFARLGKEGRRAVVDQIELQEFKSEKSEAVHDHPASEKVG